ncbi:site-specific integrase [Lactiplantibacillus plantarum]|nr:site-specific integrase [Lactiplantibacillus plantarum]MCT3271734.1 site-specific integrase [Lactiplantibacillus plantarum]
MKNVSIKSSETSKKEDPKDKVVKRNRWPRKTKENGLIDPKTGKKKWHIDVRAIKDKNDIRNLITALSENGFIGLRNALIFKIGISTGLRVSDILQLKNAEMQNATVVHVTEQKTKKHRNIYLRNLLADIMEYQQQRPDHSEWFFPSSQNPTEHLKEGTFYQQLNIVADSIGLEHVGTHTMRKTFGYQYYMATIADPKIATLPTLMTIFNHSSEQMTIRYIGLETERIQETLEDFHPF